MKDLTRRKFSALAASSPLLVKAGPAFSDASASVRATVQAQIRSAPLGPDMTMHTYLSSGLPGGLGSVNSHIFESDDALLVLDTQFYKAAAEDLRAFIDSLGKPVERIILSHAHPDHVFGIAWLGDLGPVMATDAVRGQKPNNWCLFLRT